MSRILAPLKQSFPLPFQPEKLNGMDFCNRRELLALFMSILSSFHNTKCKNLQCQLHTCHVFVFSHLGLQYSWNSLISCVIFFIEININVNVALPVLLCHVTAILMFTLFAMFTMFAIFTMFRCQFIVLLPLNFFCCQVLRKTVVDHYCHILYHLGLDLKILRK